MRQKPILIGLAGESGVGKSTIAEIIGLSLGLDKTLIISTDDLHKWERKDKNWETFTHLNPDANNLDLGDEHLERLSGNQTIFRSKYNHSSGHFDPPSKMEPNDFIIVEGLHSFYTKFSQEKLDIKIFIDTDEDLRVHWKILRDTEERGYKYNVVLDMINKRKTDSDKIRGVQIDEADAIIKISTKHKIQHIGDKHEKIEITLQVSSLKSIILPQILDFIEQYTLSQNKFIDACEIFGNDIEMVQDNGGNISTKIYDKYMMIKSSGTSLKNIDADHGYSIIDNTKLIDELDKNISDDNSFSSELNKSTVSSRYKNPSMETGFHTLMNKYVIHLHPIYITTLLCLEKSQEIMDELYDDYQYVSYVSPGLNLFNKIKSMKKSKIYFLENHGIILSSDDIDEISSILYAMNSKAKQYIGSKLPSSEFNLTYSDIIVGRSLFPDAVLFEDNLTKQETRAAHGYIATIGNQLGKIRYLNDEQIAEIRNMTSEKYRKSL